MKNNKMKMTGVEKRIQAINILEQWIKNLNAENNVTQKRGNTNEQ